jgi:subtilisin family serine protease
MTIKMKHIILFLILAGISPGLFAQTDFSYSESDFFYSENGEIITLKIRKDIVVIRTLSNSAVESWQQHPDFKSVTILHEGLIKAEVDPETFNMNDLGMEGIADAYYMLEYIPDGCLQVLSDQIFIRPSPEKSIDMIIQESELSGKVEQTEFIFPEGGIYQLTLNYQMKDILHVCRHVYETGMVDFVEPDFFREGLVGNTLWPEQWNLKNTGQGGGTPGIDINVESAWNITQGNSNIKIAIVDEGVDLTHPDLQANLLTGLGFDATGAGSGGSYTGNDAHGTSCAGVIGAINNSIGVVGVAPGCRMIPVKVFNNGGGSINNASAGLNYACNAGADVINNSWGFWGTPSPTSEAMMTSVINNCVNSGRNGKGCVVVFCTHNDGDAIRYPAYLDNVIAVGSVTCVGKRVSDSNYGDALDVVAPVGGGMYSINNTQVYTTDLQGSLGENTASGTAGDYRSDFRGTSAACPQVAGIAALILSVNPNLTAQEVRDIIDMTAQKLNGYVFQTTSAHPNGSWNNEVGYGLVDAQAAVQAATCTGSMSSQTISSNKFIRSCNNSFNIPNVTVTNNAKLTVKANETSFSGEFEVQPGSQFEIR